MLNISDALRGYTETIILRFLNKEDSYGYQINKAIREISNNTYELKEATLYCAFKRMEEKGLIESYWSVSTTYVPSRKYYRITKKGKEYYKQSIEDYEYSRKLIDALIKEGE